MNIQEAREKTGKAYYEGQPSNFKYADIDEFGNLSFYDHKDEWACRIFYEIGQMDNWQPYKPIAEIRPEKAGELWKKNVDKFVYLIVELRTNELIVVPSVHDLLSFSLGKDGKEMVHNKNGWTRLYPPVEDNSIERIEIEISSWNSGRYSFNSEYKGGLIGKKCILEIPKDKP